VVAVPTGAPRLAASDVEGWDLTGRRRTVGLTTPGLWTLLFFLGSHCDGCLPFWTVSRSRESCGLEPEDRVVVVTRGPRREEPAALVELVAASMRGDAAAAASGTLVMSSSSWDAYRVLGPPFFVLVDGVAVVTEGVAWSVEQVAADVARARRREAGEAGRRPRVGR